MTQLIEAHLRGVVGIVRCNTVGETPITHFTVASNRVYKNPDGMAVVTTTWMPVVYFGTMQGLDKGSWVDVKGRIKTSSYTGSDGIGRTSYEIIAKSIDILPDPLPMEE